MKTSWIRMLLSVSLCVALGSAVVNAATRTVCHKTTSPYDVNHDGVVDETDVILVNEAIMGAFNAPNLDVNHDGTLTVADLQLVAKHLGWTATTICGPIAQ